MGHIIRNSKSMYQINLSPKEITQIQGLKKQARSKRIFRRLQSLLLKAKGRSHQEIADTTGVSVDTVTDWLKRYLDHGLDALVRPIDYDRRSSVIDPHKDMIKRLVQERMVSTLAQLQDLIKSEFRIHLEQSWLSRCIKKNSICLTRKPV